MRKLALKRRKHDLSMSTIIVLFKITKNTCKTNRKMQKSSEVTLQE